MAVLTMFLKKQGLSTAARTLGESVCFFDHLVYRLHSIHKTRYLVGRELTTLKRDTHTSYHGNLCKEYGESLVDVMENFPNLPANKCKINEDSLINVVENFPNPHKEEREQSISHASPTNLPLDSKKLKAMARIAETDRDGQLPLNTLYLMKIGLDMNQIKEMARKYPSITCPGLERKLKPFVVFLLDLGVAPSVIPNLLCRVPRLCDLSLSKNIIPSMAYIETLGLDKSQWVKVIKRSPNLLTYSKQKVKAAVDYLYELGLSSDRIGKCLARSPHIVSFSVDDNLRLKAEYFRSIGVNLTSLLSRYPEVFRLSIECQLKPVTEFLLDKGYRIDEIGTMASRYGSMYCLSLKNNLIPKWNFFLTMDYPRSELVKFPTYFGLSLDRRIKPRYAQMRECGLRLSLSQLLTPTDFGFVKILNKKRMKKMLDAQQSAPFHECNNI